MDNRRFDSLAKSLASGASRRSVLKGILGIGSAALAGGALLERETDAARRPTATPTPTAKCPGQQTWNGSACVCPSGLTNCGPACCTEEAIPAPQAEHTECCDNACCHGSCYGEELCCPTNNRPGGLPPTHTVCHGPNGPVCLAGQCCDDGDCGDPCQICDVQTRTCQERCPDVDQICCPGQAGPGSCVTGECCLGAPCGEGRICCQGPEGAVCVAGNCCDAGDCPASTACTTTSCQHFVCVATPVDCTDGNRCTTDACDPTTGCLHTPIDCNDNNPCTTDTCDPATGCVHTPVSCDDGNACTVDTCDPVQGCVHTPVVCDENNACRTNGRCDPQKGCVYTTTNCADGNACTVDTCDPVRGCLHTPVDCNDNNLCTTEYCDPQVGCVYTVIDCDDGNACTEDWCDPTTGCKHTPINCDDGNPCTTNECDSASGCVHNPISCDDGDPCTTNECYPNTGCIHNRVDCSGLDDPTKCLVGACSNGTCVAQSSCGGGTGCCGDGTCTAACSCLQDGGICTANSECCGGCCIVSLSMDEWIAVCQQAGMSHAGANICAQLIVNDGYGYPLTCLTSNQITMPIFGIPYVVTLPCMS